MTLLREYLEQYIVIILLAVFLGTVFAIRCLAFAAAEVKQDENYNVSR